MALSSIKDVEIDDGEFKYILIEASGKDGKKCIVRGYKRSPYHSDIFEEVEKGLDNSVKLECLGGGKIKHDPQKKEIKVHGTSQGYGKADHAKTCEILKKNYEDYKNITCSDDD